MSEDNLPMSTRVLITSNQSWGRRTRISKRVKLESGLIGYWMEDGGVFSRDEFEVVSYGWGSAKRKGDEV